MTSPTIREARKRLALSQGAVAGLLADRGHPVSQSTFSAWERAERVPSKIIARALGDILGVEVPVTVPTEERRALRLLRSRGYTCNKEEGE